MSATIRSAIDDALGALDSLQELGEEIEDEWTYVTDLGASWRSRLEEVQSARGAEAVDAAVADAVERAIVEAGSVRDPHRAIDWLSTFPQVVLLALGERP